MNTNNAMSLSIQKETGEVCNFIRKYRVTLILALFALAVLNSIAPVHAKNLFDVAQTTGQNVTKKLTNVLKLGIFPAVIVICACGIALSKDPKKVEIYKSWLIRAVIALILVAGYDYVMTTISETTGLTGLGN